MRITKTNNGYWIMTKIDITVPKTDTISLSFSYLICHRGLKKKN